MYFKRLFFKMPLCSSSPRQINFAIDELALEHVNKLFNDFVDQAQEFEKRVIKFGFEDLKEKNLFNKYQEFYQKFSKFVLTLHKIVFEFKGDISDYFKNGKRKKVSRRWFFSFKKLICKIISYKTNNFNQFFYKSRRPKTIKKKYPDNVRRFICNFWYFYFCKKHVAWMNFTNLWLKLVNKEILTQLGDFSKLAESTLRKILNEDPRTRGKMKLVLKVDHPFRNKPKPPGQIQLDFKVFGLNQTGVNRYVYCLDAIETQTRIPYSKVFEKPSLEAVMNELESIIKFYENLGIKINTIRTDNAMMFKRTNFVYSSEFNTWCINKLIEHEFTPLGQPQCDGCVERYHKTLDDEVVCFLKQVKTIEEVNNIIQDYVNYYIYGRYFHYCELKDLPKKQQYMKPINAISFFKSYNVSI